MSDGSILQQALEHINWWNFFAGLGLFLYGMLQTEAALRSLIGHKIKKILHDHTHHPLHSVLTGTVATALLQSSTLVGLLVLAMVGAKVLELKNALGVIVGANLGTTFTGWIVATIGFKLDFSQFALPMIAVGSIWLITVRDEGKSAEVFRVIIGIGLLLFGLDFMKSGVITDSLILNSAPDPWIYLATGIALTAIIQSSSAAMMIALTALHADAITLHNAAAFVIGADLGTTSTILLGSLKGSADKKRVGIAHFLFNLGIDMAAFFALLPLLVVTVELVGPVDPLLALVAFHTTFNLIGVLLVLPLLGPFSRMLEHMFRSRDQSARRLLSPQLIVDVGSALVALERVIKELATDVHEYSTHVLNGRCQQDDPELNEEYKRIKAIEGELLDFALSLRIQILSEEESRRLEALTSSVRNLVHSAKSMKDCEINLVDLRFSTKMPEQQIYQSVRDSLTEGYDMAKKIISDVDHTLAFEDLNQLRTKNQAAHDYLHQNIIDHFRQENLEWPAISSVLNMNRELFIANSDFLEALARIYLQPTRYEDLNRLPA